MRIIQTLRESIVRTIKLQNSILNSVRFFFSGAPGELRADGPGGGGGAIPEAEEGGGGQASRYKKQSTCCHFPNLKIWIFSFREAENDEIAAVIKSNQQHVEEQMVQERQMAR